jgi:transposase
VSDASTETKPSAIDVDLVIAQFEWLDTDTHKQALVEAARARDVYRELALQLREKVAKLERGLVGSKSHRFKGEDDSQLSLQLLAELLDREASEDDDPKKLAEQLAKQAEQDAATATDDEGGDDEGAWDQGKVHRRNSKPTGRKTARADLPKVTVEVTPEEVKRLGLDAFERIGEERSTMVERRVSSLVEVTVVRPKYRAKTPEAIDAVREQRQQQGAEPEVEPASWITVAPAPEAPVPRAFAGPGLLANVAGRRFDDHLPYHRLENVFEREGMRLGRSTLYGWMEALRELFSPLIGAMLHDARSAPYLCTDATGVLVQAPDKCSRGHFWVLVAP